jgi:exopolysaccharide biosynthesis polyprenyl glycosylphosphotransferase
MTLARALAEVGVLSAAASVTSLALAPWHDAVSTLAKTSTLAFCCVVAFYYNDLYDFRIVRSFRDFASRLLQAFGIAFILLAVLYASVPDLKMSNGQFLLSILAILGVLVPLRAASYGLMRRRLFVERVLILGRGPLANKIVREIESRPYLRYEIVGFADDASGSDQTPRRYPTFGPLERLDKILLETDPHRIILAMTERRARLPVRQLLDARMTGRVVEDAVNAYERFTGKVAIESLTPSNLIFSSDFKKSRLNLAAGRAASLIVAVIGLILFAPLLGLIALAVKLERPTGPVFFVQERLGLRSKRFKLVKFRTMRATTDSKSEWVLDNSERITRVGKWLRKFRLDEIPQFINVIRGDMNLVGPRPHPVSNVELFGEKIAYYSLRSTIRPGITGWAQIRLGYANNLEEETEKMRFDLYYIKHLSFWLDLRILFDTVKTVLFGRGAQGGIEPPSPPSASGAATAIEVGGR